jgi:hypothetical protein
LPRLIAREVASRLTLDQQDRFVAHRFFLSLPELE